MVISNAKVKRVGPKRVIQYVLNAEQSTNSGHWVAYSSSLAARWGNLAKIPPNQVIDDFGRGSSVESESE